MVKYKTILYFGHRSYRHLDLQEYRTYTKIRDAINEIIEKKRVCRMKDLAKYFKVGNSLQTISKYVFILCASSEIPGKQPQFRMITKLAMKKPNYKKGVYITRNVLV